MPRPGEYDFDRDEPVSIPLDTETTLRALLETEPTAEDESDEASPTASC